MAIGERIHFFRTLRGMTQKYLGMAIGFPERSADVRLAQYENGTRSPKADITAVLANALDGSPDALNVPDIDSEIGLMHTLFTLGDCYGLEVCESEGEVHLRVNPVKGGSDGIEPQRMLEAWNTEMTKLKNKENTQEEYDRWRYHYPKYDTSGKFRKVGPSHPGTERLLGFQVQRHPVTQIKNALLKFVSKTEQSILLVIGLESNLQATCPF